MRIYTCRTPGWPTETLVAKDELQAAHVYIQDKPEINNAFIRIVDFITRHSTYAEVTT